jgi:hypothetical protein
MENKTKYICSVTGDECKHQDWKDFDCYNKPCENIKYTCITKEEKAAMIAADKAKAGK